MTVYRPDHKPWHDLLLGECTCADAWADRGMVDDRCQYHRTIEVFEDYGFDGRVLLVESYPNPGDGTALSEAEHDEAHEAWYRTQEAIRLGYLVQVWPKEDTT